MANFRSGSGSPPLKTGVSALWLGVAQTSDQFLNTFMDPLRPTDGIGKAIIVFSGNLEIGLTTLL